MTKYIFIVYTILVGDIAELPLKGKKMSPQELEKIVDQALQLAKRSCENNGLQASSPVVGAVAAVILEKVFQDVESISYAVRDWKPQK